MDHAGKVDAAASAPAAFRPRQSNVVARAKGDDKPRDASKDLAATNPESRAENPDPVAPANPTDGDENAPEEEDAEEDAPEEDAPLVDDADDASASSSSASSSSGPAPAASKNRDALRAVVDNAEVLCLVAAGGVKAAQMRARLSASPRDFASSSTSRLVAARASAPPPPSSPRTPM